MKINTVSSKQTLSRFERFLHSSSQTPDAIRDEALLNLLLYTGLRVSECAALRVDDVLFKGRKYREISSRCTRKPARRWKPTWRCVPPIGDARPRCTLSI